MNYPLDSLFWQNRNVLVTGAGGFIGSHLVHALVHLGARVRAFVHYNSRGDVGMLRFLPPELLARVEIVVGDLRDLTAVEEAVWGVTHVFHLGALTTAPYSYIHPAQVIETNVQGTLNVLLAARDVNLERLIHTSTSEVYGTALRVPIDENHPLQGQSPYSASKIGADQIASSFYRVFNVPVVTVRPFNTYGPRQSARAIVPTIITQALTQPTIFLGNLDTRRDLTFITDTLTGFLRAGETPAIEGETFNLGTGREIRVGDLARRIIELVNRDVQVMVDETRVRPEKSEVQRLVADNRLAQRRLGWKPTVELEQGLRETVQWIRDHLDLYKPGRYEI